MSESGVGRWLKYGCLGCAGIVVLGVAIVAAVTGTAWMRVQGEEIEEGTLTHDLGPADSGARLPETTGDGDRVMPEGERGRMILDLAHAEFHIEPALPGEPMRIEARYDTKTYKLEESLESDEESGWTYHLEFRRTGSGVIAGLAQLFGATSPRLKLYVPPDVPIDLDLQLDQGGAEVELGGLWLTAASIEVDMGGLILSMEDPLREPLEQLTINVSMGGMQAMRLGNASPRKLDVTCSMGGMEIDLRGAWRNDAAISISSSMGGGEVRLPRDVQIEGLDTQSEFRPPTEEPEVPLPTLTFETSNHRGDLVFVD